MATKASYQKAKKKKKIAHLLRRDHYRCVKCGVYDNLSRDHIIPKSKGGINGIVNIQIMCKKCNLEKGDKVECYIKRKGTLNMLILNGYDLKIVLKKGWKNEKI